MTGTARGAMPDLVVATVAAKSFLPCARVLARSLREQHPGLPLHVLLADEVEGCFDPAREPFETIGLEALGIADPRRFRFQYTRRELAIALKAFLLDHLLDRGWRRVLYLDADVLVTGDLSPVFDALARHSVLLTPHLLDPLAGAAGGERELQVLRAGAFNNGVLGVAARPEARRLLVWWRERLAVACRLAPAQGLHHDQRWMDLAPALFEGVHVLRDVGVNVGYWNLPERRLESQEGGYLCAGSPLRLFHFSGFDPRVPDRLSRHASATPAEMGGPVEELCRRYARELGAAGWEASRSWPYAYGCFSDGTPIPSLAREVYLALGDDVSRFGDPFDASAPGSFAAWLRQPEATIGGGPPGLPRLWVAVLERRPDVRGAFPDARGADRARFLAWAAGTGAREHGIAASLLP
jgi:hypothetical protein